MIDLKYKNIYDEFIKQYEEIHVNPYHEITKEELNKIYNDLINKMNINDNYSFKYFIDYIIKRLSGIMDAHTYYQSIDLIPLNFRKFNDEILINYPDKLRGKVLISINGIKIKDIINELEDVITYGTEEKRIYEIEKALFNRTIMFGLPSFRNSDKLIYEIEDNNIIITKDEKYNNLFDYKQYIFGTPTEYKIIDNCLIYNHSSIQSEFKDKIEESINKLKTEDLSNINTIIIDIRGNTGGNSSLNKLLIDYLKTKQNKKLICLTDYRVFSGGRYALKDLINLGAITIGEKISTPINCYGNTNWVNIDNNHFSISGSYLDPFKNIGANTKEEFKEKIKKELQTPNIFKPDIEIKQTKEDYINNIDTLLEYAIDYSKR